MHILIRNQHLKSDARKFIFRFAVLEANPEIAQKFSDREFLHTAKKMQKSAKKLGASYVTAGHIFATTCKPGLEPRGTAF